MLPHRKGMLTIAKSKSSRLSYSVVVNLPLESILSKAFRYEADLSDSVVLTDCHKPWLNIFLQFLEIKLRKNC
jgi:hypothetical protein